MIPNRMIRAAVGGALLRDAFERKKGGGPGPANTMDRIVEAREVKNLADAEAVLKDLCNGLNTFCQKAAGEIQANGKLATDTKAAIDKTLLDIKAVGERIDAIEAKFNRQSDGNRIILPGELVTKSDEYVTGFATGKTRKARVEIKDMGAWMSKAIVNATGLNQPLVPTERIPGIVAPLNRRLTIRDLLPVGRTVSNVVMYVRELLFTNNAGPQVSGSPTVPAEGGLKNESDITFDLQNAAVATIAHFILASRQVLEDAPMLESYINGRLLYGLKLEEEDEILNGDGGAGTLNGLMNQATAYNRGQPGDTFLDQLLRAQTQIALSEYDTEFYVLNPQDWEVLVLLKDSQGRYLMSRPEAITPPTVWGKPVVATQSMTAGQWLAGNGTMAAQIWDRQDANVELSREDSDNFRRNMVTILAEERLALTVYRPSALVKGQRAGT